jgi:hypothetical protein
MRIPAVAFTVAVLLSSWGPVRAAEVPPAKAATVELKEGITFQAKDTLNCVGEKDADAAACLKGLSWECAPFTVKVEPSKPGSGDWLIRFPSPFPSGDTANDQVAMEWYMARDEKGEPITAPAVVVVHESGRGMVAGRAFARGLRGKGLHTFMVHLPGYGARTSADFSGDPKKILPALKQAIADVRRARDAVVTLPYVDPTMIGLQGTSLGGFVTATVAGLDHGYDRLFILLAGGQLADVILNGQRDAASMRRKLTAAGITEEQIREVTKVIEPMRLACRVDPARTWLFSGKFDDVVPPPCSLAFAKAAKLDTAHHWILPVGHYTAAVLLPAILPEMSSLMRRKVEEK